MPGPPTVAHDAPPGAGDAPGEPSLWRRGPTYDGLVRVGLLRGDAADAWRLAGALVLVGWGPVLVVALVERVTSGAWPPMATSLVHHARWLVALPALLVSNTILDTEVGRALASLRAADLVRGGDAALSERTERVRRAASGKALELAVALAALAPLVATLPAHDVASGWNQVVGLPLFRFALLLWVVRWFTWCAMVAGIAHLGLEPVASHPDRRGGLGRLATPLRSLAAGLFGLGALVAALLAEEVGRTADTRTATAWLVAYVAWAVALAVLPGLPLVRPLWRARRRGLDAWGTTACQHHRAFEARWLVRNAAHALGAPEISSTADLGSAHQAVEATSVAPLSRAQLVAVLVAALAPLLPLALQFVPLVDILKLVVGLRP